MWDAVSEFLKNWGGNESVAVIIGVILTLFATQIGPSLWAYLGRLTGWLWAMVSERGADRAFERRYLDWLIDQHRHLGLLPAQVVARKWGERQKWVELEQIYVRLSIPSQTGYQHWAETYKKGESSWRKPPSRGLRLFHYLIRSSIFQSNRFDKYMELREVSYQKGDIGLLIDRHQRLVVRGDPGSGKTTLLRYLAVTCARARRNNKKDGDSSWLVKQRLLWDEQPFPILVRLSRHGDVVNWGDERGLLDIFMQEMPRELRQECPDNFFERRLEQGKCLILLDAFDELGSPEARHVMARRIADFLHGYGHPDNRIVVTTRIVGYEGQLDPHRFTVRTVQTLHTGEVRALVKQRYKAIAFAESVGRKEQEQLAIKRRLKERSERLIARIEDTQRLRQLASNPMLLSLIVLVHFLKIELPEERVLLYRDCVEILTERWQRVKREELGLINDKQELTMSQKLLLLREMAFAMQQGRQADGSQAVITKAKAQQILVHKLPDFLNMDVPEGEKARKEAYCRRAEAWLGNIQVESGILVERGLNQEGDPLISFSHLTFQEYLTAVALHEVSAYQSLLWPNLLNTAWREVVLLYAVLSSDATPIIEKLLTWPSQPDGVLLAGYCLAEPLKRLDRSVQQEVVARLKILFFRSKEEDQIHEVSHILQTIGSHDVMAFMRGKINDHLPMKRLAAVRILRWTSRNNPLLNDIKASLLQTLQNENELGFTIAVSASLSQIGDPRFVGPEPIMMPIPSHTLGELTSWASIKELFTPPGWEEAQTFRQRFTLVGRSLDYALFILWRVIFGRTRIIGLAAFEISKYPVTNVEYSRFVDATGHQTPRMWIEGQYPAILANYPVIGITFSDADAYCKWLSQQTGKKYRLPVEWEWEIAATGGERLIKYPWGQFFDVNKCNTKEAGIEHYIPVGCYHKNESRYGVIDMSGNIWEITRGKKLFFNILFFLATITIFILISFISKQYIESNFYKNSIKHELKFWEIIYELTLKNYLKVDYKINTDYWIELGMFIGDAIMFVNLLFATIFFIYISFLRKGVLRGGAWYTEADEATNFYRQNSFGNKENTGFRCVREL